MKKCIRGFLFPIFCFLLFCSQAYAIPTVYLELSDDEIYVGDTFNINVYVNGVGTDDFESGDEVFSFGFDVVFEDSFFTYNGATIDPFADSFVFPDTDVAANYFPFLPSGDDIFLASLNFTALSVGTFSLGIESDIWDPCLSQGLVTWIYFDGRMYDEDLEEYFGENWKIDLTSSITIDVNERVNPVPEPATMLLLGTGLIGLAGFGRRMKS